MPKDPDDRIEPGALAADADAGSACEGAARRAPGTAPDREAIKAGPRPEPPAAARRKPLDAAARARIGRGLRLHFADVLGLPVPERLRTLLDDLAARSDPESPR